MKRWLKPGKLLAWWLFVFLFIFSLFPSPVRADHSVSDVPATGLIDGEPFVFDPGSLRSRTACLLAFGEGEAVDLLHFRHDERVYTASLTKIMTAWLAFELMESQGRGLDDQVLVSAADLAGLRELDASLAGFQEGESVTYRDLFHGLLISSGCEAANTLARVTAGSIGDFVSRMNDQAGTLGLTGTRYANPTGLFNAGNYGTARDVAVLLGFVLENAFLREVMTLRQYTSGATTQHPQGIRMRHYLSYYGEIAGIDSSSIQGGKTGQLKEAGYCLASFKDIQGLTFVLCTTGADDPGGHLADHVAIYEALSEQLSGENVTLTGIGNHRLPAAQTTERETDQSETSAGGKGPQRVINLVTALFLGTLILLVLFLLFSLLVKRKIEKEL